MTQIAIAELVLDFTIYPRAEVQAQHVASLVDALEAGVTLPPIVADKKSKRVVDGFHRYNANRRVYGDDAKIDVVLKSYPNESALFLDAMRLNAGHGRALTSFDRAHCIIAAEHLKIEPAQIAAALAITVDRIGELKANKIGKLHIVGKTDRSIPIKRTISHMGGQQLTQKQSDANDKLGGMNQLFYVNQLVLLIENDLLDRSNSHLMAALRNLAQLLTDEFVEKAA